MTISEDEDESLAYYLESEVLSEVSDQEESKAEEEEKVERQPKRLRVSDDDYDEGNPSKGMIIVRNNSGTTTSDSLRKRATPRSIETEFFSKIPPELFHHILKFLSSEDLISCALVCRLLNYAASDESLWRRLDCPFASEVWSQIHGMMCWDHMKGRGEVVDWVMQVWECMDEEALRFFCVVLWCIWGNRNNSIFGGTCRTASGIVGFASDYISEFAAATIRTTVASQTPILVWKALPEGQFKINFDGAIGKAGVAGIGVVVRDFLGRVVAACTEQVAGLTDVDHVEALGALRATSLAMDLGLAWVQFEGDSLTVIRSMASDKEDLSNIGVVIDQIRSNLKSFCGSGCFHVKRSGNNVAHCLARMALSLDGFHVWMEEVPDSIASAVFAERSS